MIKMIADRRAASPGKIGRAILPRKVHSCLWMLARSCLLELAALLLIIASAIAGDQPTKPETVAPPETFTAEQRSSLGLSAGPARRASLESSKQAGSRNAVDRFILAQLEEIGAASPRPRRIGSH